VVCSVIIEAASFKLSHNFPELQSFARLLPTQNIVLQSSFSASLVPHPTQPSASDSAGQSPTFCTLQIHLLTYLLLYYLYSVLWRCCFDDRKGIRLVKSAATEQCYCYRTDAFLKLEGKTAHSTITVFLTYLGSMVAACCP